MTHDPGISSKIPLYFVWNLTLSNSILYVSFRGPLQLKKNYNGPAYFNKLFKKSLILIILLKLLTIHRIKLLWIDTIKSLIDKFKKKT